MIVAAASYEVADPSVDSQMVSLRASGADVLVEFTNLKAGAQAIRKTYDIGWRPLQIVGVTGSAVCCTRRDLLHGGPPKNLGFTRISWRRRRFHHRRATFGG
jgi:branched-chain amino acid transport system substrate-binding protein